MEDIVERSSWLQITVVVVFTSISVALLIRREISSSHKKRLPPGPRGWPVLGSLLAIGKNPHASLYNLSKRYGPLMFMRLGSVPTLVASSPEMAKEILQTHDQIMASRPSSIILKKLTYNRNGMAFAPYGQSWRYLRKICTVQILTTSRVNQFQGMRQDEVMAMMHAILKESKQGKPVNVNKLFVDLASNNITQMMIRKSYFGEKGASTHNIANTFQELVRENNILAGAFNFADYVPFLSHFDLQGLNKRAEYVYQRFDEILESIIEEHRSKQSSIKKQQGELREDFVDLLLAVPNENNQSGQGLPNDAIKALLKDMLAASVNTTTASLEWILCELLRQPRLMKRAQEELDLVVGPNRLVDEADIPQLNYLRAVVTESFRVHSPAPFLLPHESTEECEIAGFCVRAGTRILVNAWAIQRDPSVWENPLQFDPDRFLNSTIDVTGQHFELLPFGSGRRMCPGMNLGLILVQIATAQLLHTFSWTLPDGHKPEDLDMTESFGLGLHKTVQLSPVAKLRLAEQVICPPNRL